MKNTTSTSCWRSGGLGTSIHQCKLERDAATTCSLHMGTYMHRTMCKLSCCCILLCNLRWWCFFFHQLAQILHLRSWWPSQLALVVFFLGALVHLLMCILQLALCGGGAACGCIFMWWWLYICGGSGCTWRFCCRYTTEDPSWRTFPAIVYTVLHTDSCEDKTSVPCMTWSLRKSHQQYFSATFAGTPLNAVPLVHVCLSGVLRLAGSSSPHSSCYWNISLTLKPI